MDNLDILITCPYNTSHQIFKSRMQYHLIKCAKTHPTAENEICPFDATHRVPKPEYQFHLTVCPNRKVLESHKYKLESETSHGDFALAPYHHPDLPPTEENWDDEPPVPAYQPNLRQSNQLILRNLVGATKSERKAFRLQERKRVQQLNENGSLDEAACDVTPLRLPKQPSLAFKGLQAIKMNPSMGLGRGNIHNFDDNPGNVNNIPAKSLDQLPLGMGRGSFKKQ